METKKFNLHSFNLCDDFLHQQRQTVAIQHRLAITYALRMNDLSIPPRATIITTASRRCQADFEAHDRARLRTVVEDFVVENHHFHGEPVLE